MDTDDIAPYVQRASEVYDRLRQAPEFRGALFADGTPIVALACMMYVEDRLRDPSVQAIGGESRVLNVGQDLDTLVRNGVEPYIAVEVREWDIPYEDGGLENVDYGVRRVFEELERGGWKAEPTYLRWGEILPYSGKLITEVEEIPEDKEITVIFSNSGRYLRVNLDYERDTMDFILTTFFPNFIQGVHNLEGDFFPQSKRDLLEFMEGLDEIFGYDSTELEAIEFSEAADRIENLDFDD